MLWVYGHYTYVILSMRRSDVNVRRILTPKVGFCADWVNTANYTVSNTYYDYHYMYLVLLANSLKQPF